MVVKTPMTDSNHLTPSLAQLRENVIDLAVSIAEADWTPDDPASTARLAELHVQYRAAREALRRRELRAVRG